jgi:autotransporter-associated beta strand protein/adhesin HecA-like repeat protein
LKFLPFLLTLFALSNASADDYFNSLLQGDGFGSVVNLNSDATVNFQNGTSVTYSPNLAQNIIAISPSCGSDTNYCPGENLASNSYLFNNTYQSVLNLSSNDLNKFSSSDGQITNIGVLKKTYELSSGAYSFSWAFAAYDYMPFRDGAFFQLYNNDSQTSEVSILARNGTNSDFENTLNAGSSFNGYDPQTLVMPNYGSTPWQQYDFNLSTPGSYTLAFGAFNYGDTALDPVLFLSGFAGQASGTGLITTFYIPTLTNIIAGGGTLGDGFTGADAFYPVFEGGIYKITSYENTNALDSFFISTGSSGTFTTTNEANGTVIGSISGSGDLTINGDGRLFLSNVNTYTGTTTIDSGTNLTLNFLSNSSTFGSISESSKVILNGTFNIEAAGQDNLIKSLSGSGSVILGGKKLTITDGANDNFSGIISGAGNVALSSGTQTFSGGNIYTGSTAVNTGATMALSGLGSIATSSSIEVNGVFDISQTTTSSTSINKLNGSSNGIIKLGGDNLIIGTDGINSGSFSGSIQDGGLGNGTQGSLIINGNGYTQNLLGNNTYTGDTSINNGTTLALIGSGSIMTSNQLTNYGTFDITDASGDVSLRRYTQSSSGNLVINFAPTNNQHLNISGVAQLGGLLTLNALAGSYSAGTYTLITSSGLSGNFSSWTDNIGGTLKQRLIYDANNVYLKLYDGPDNLNTQSSMQYQASQLRSAFNTQTVAANFALNYDCNIFDVKGLCISAGGRYTTIDNPGINNSAAIVTLGYKVNPNIRIGAYLDQNINISNPTGINISNKTPLIGLYAVWNKEQSGLGYQVRVANTYQDKDVTSTRTVFDTSEAGSGKSSLQSQSYLAELSYAFQYQDKTLVRPYAGLRYTHLKQKGYTEATTDTVTDPLTLAALRDKSVTALLGVKINRSLTDKATLTAQLGLEQDVHHKVGNYSATNSDIGNLDSIAFNSNIKRTRPVASIGAFYDVTKTQRASATINYQQLPFQSTGSTTAYFNYMIGF